MGGIGRHCTTRRPAIAQRVDVRQVPAQVLERLRHDVQGDRRPAGVRPAVRSPAAAAPPEYAFTISSGRHWASSPLTRGRCALALGAAHEAHTAEGHLVGWNCIACIDLCMQVRAIADALLGAGRAPRQVVDMKLRAVSRAAVIHQHGGSPGAPDGAAPKVLALLLSLARFGCEPRRQAQASMVSARPFVGLVDVPGEPAPSSPVSCPPARQYRRSADCAVVAIIAIFFSAVRFRSPAISPSMSSSDTPFGPAARRVRCAPATLRGVGAHAG